MGGSKPKTTTPREAPNTLVSNSEARLIDLISEGPIVGLVNGFQSVFIDETALQRSDGGYNFQGVNVETRTGEPDQSAFNGFPFIEYEENVNSEIKYGVPVVRTITDLTADRVAVKIRIPSLYVQNEQNGDLNGSQVDIDIEIKESGGSFKRVPIATGEADFNPAGATESTVFGLRVFCQTQVTGVLGQTVENTVIFKYKLSGAGSWVTAETRTITTILTQDNINSVSLTPLGSGNFSGSNPAITKLIPCEFIIDGLELGAYEILIEGATVVSAKALTLSTITIAGKNTSPFEKQFDVALTGSGPWDIRVTRLTADSASAYLQNETYWGSYTRIVDAKLSYPNCALVKSTYNAQLFGSNIGSRGYLMRGKIIQIPDNYNPETRAYTGLWGGTFTTGYTNNPAWVLYDVLTNSLYGLGREIDASQVDKFTFYEAAQYCDELVNDGFGGLEPRYTFNAWINQARDAYELVNVITQSFHGMTYWAAGAVVCGIDKPADPVKLVSNSDVIDGIFDYSSTGKRARHSVATVTYNNPEYAYKPDIIQVQDTDAIARWGWNPIDVAAYGCTSRGQAWRYGKWILDTEQYQTQQVKYKAGLDHIDAVPGDVVLISDKQYSGARTGGACGASSTTSTINLDHEVTLLADELYTLYVTLPDLTVESLEVTSAAGVHTSLTVDGNYSIAPIQGAQWGLSSVSLEPRPFKIISIIENEDHTFSVTALQYDADKYDRIENNTYVETPVYTLNHKGPISKPASGLTINDYIKETSTGIVSAVTLSWQASLDRRVDNYIINGKGPNDPDFKYIGETNGLSIDILDVIAGDWSFQVIPESKIIALQGPSAQASFAVYGLTLPPADVENLRVSTLSDSVTLTWDPAPDLDLNYYVLRFSPLTAGATWEASQVLVESIAKNQITVTVPAMVGTYLLKAVDTLGIESENAASVISTFNGLSSMNAIETVAESPTFAGTHTGTGTDDVGLFLTSGDSVDDWPNVDDVYNVDIGAGDMLLEGFYAFDNSVDLGAVYTSRLTSEIEAIGVNLLDNVDLWENVDLIDNVDGASAGSWGIELQIRTTTDDPSGSPTWSDWMPFVIGDYTARAFEYRLKLYSYSYGISPYVTTCKVYIDMPDTIQRRRNIASGTSALGVVFDVPFHSTPAIAIMAYSLATGDYYEVTAISRTGFTIVFKNSGGTIIDRTFDFIATGYGAGT